ncbi:DUF948 domain-containing protein [Catellatospora coxensis]|uniref:DUF948 domain-containing protein n=1 Tax=Catellatospora coxensis TaxID=310354 RepID=A0A8J3L9Q5_9ACTN|nr:DUF948 domain-containing protein [Catellatospora coxensis]GIG08835.1 hypothetical protein Cco03nite_55350 [Catellatospora coxensis]
MSGTEIAALVAAGAFAMLVLVLAVPILRLRRTVDATTDMIREVTAKTGPLLDNVNNTVGEVNTTVGQVQTTLDGINVQLVRVDAVTGPLSSAAANIAKVADAITGASATPVGKAATLAFGIRRALAARNHRQ